LVLPNYPTPELLSCYLTPFLSDMIRTKNQNTDVLGLTK
jgi:hypothetical protein